MSASESLTLNAEQIQRVIKVMEHARKRPRMYIGKSDPLLLWVYLNGFKNALRLAAGFDDEAFVLMRYEAAEAHGLGIECRDLHGALVDRGLNNEEIIDEMLSIELETWQHLLETVGEQPATDRIGD